MAPRPSTRRWRVRHPSPQRRLRPKRTGDNSRWSTRSAIWKEGWRNLHQSDARIDAEFVVEGAKGTTVVSREWKPDAKLEEADTVVSARGSKKSDLETMGWAGAVEMYRPFQDATSLAEWLARARAVLPRRTGRGVR